MHLSLLFAFLPLLLSACPIGWLFAANYRGVWSRRLQVLASGSVVVLAALAGPWALTSYYLRYVVLALFVAVALRNLLCSKRHNRITSSSEATPQLVSILLLFGFTALNAFVISGTFKPSEAVGLAFPLKSGNYYILQGGGSVLTNPFHVLSGENYALDIVKLKWTGNRATTIAPSALTDYEIFGQAVYSPCRGFVSATRDGMPDNAPGATDNERPEGNHILLRCSDVEVLLAHLQQNSINVSIGEVVAENQQVAKVGNSGNSLEPHLHISAKKRGEHVPMRFNDKYLSINSIIGR